MKTKHRIGFLILFSFAPMLLFSQEKVSPANNNNEFKFEKLKEEQNSSDDFQKNYDKGREYYNAGVQIIFNANPGLTVEEMDEIVNKSGDQFKLAIPFFLKAHEFLPTSKKTLQGLIGAYYSISDKEKSDKYKKELDLLNRK